MDDYLLAQRLSDLGKLRLNHGDLRLRIPTMPEIVFLAAKSHGNILTPGQEDYLTPWATEPSANVYQLNFIKHHIDTRLEMSRDVRRLNFFAFLGNTSIGQVSLSVKNPNDDPEKAVSTGSWVLRSHQGRGYGKQMRAAVLELAFRELGANVARSSAHLDNPASNRVSESLGYKKDGLKARTLPSVTNNADLQEQKWLLRKADFVPVDSVIIHAPAALLKFLSFG